MIGQTLNNRYTVNSRLGKGAMGIVYRATDTQTGRDVALKVISGDLAIDSEMLERFKREGEALARLRHPNIVEFLDAFQYEDHYVIVMEYIPGGSLHEVIEKGPVSIEQANRIALELCDALIRSHHLNIVHRDLKPENVLIAEDGTPKLADFGVARLSEGTRMTRSGTQVGTPYYMSPEAWEGKPLDAQADIWSLGVVLFEMLAGQVPFGGDTGAAVMNKVLTSPPTDLKKLRADVPSSLVKIVTKMLSRDKNRRYQTMRQVAVDLESGQLTTTPKPSSTPRVAAPKRSTIFNRRFFLLVGVALAGILVAINFPAIRAVLAPADPTVDDVDPTEPVIESTAPAQPSSSLVPGGLWLQILGRGYIVVATDPNYAPQSFLNTEGIRPGDTKCPSDALTESEMQGFDVDVATAIGESLGVETCFVTPSWDLITAGSWVDKWDVSVGSMTITTARQAVLDFSVPYYFTPAVVAVRSSTGFSTLADLEGQSLCAGASTTYEYWLQKDLVSLGLPESSIYAEAPNVSVVTLATDQECAQAIASGREDFVGYVTSETVVDANITEGFPVRKLGSPVFSEDLAIALDKQSAFDTDSLRAKIDELILEMRENRRLAVLSNQWFGVNLTRIPDVSDSGNTDCFSTDVFCVGLVTGIGTVNDNSFNQAAWEGVQRAEQELGAQVDLIETADAGDYEKNIATFGDAGYDVIVTVGFELGEATNAAASAYPEVDFIGVDQFQAETTEGVAGLNFPEDQAGFLVGALAARMSESHKIGAVCGTDEVAPVWRYGEGYRAGAAYADNLTGTSTEVIVVYHNDVDISQTFIDPEWGAETARLMIDQGVDVVFGCGGITSNGALTAAALDGAYVIGVDVDQYFTLSDAAPRMLSSALKLITPGVFDLIKAAQDDTFTSGNVPGDVGYAPYHDLDGEVPAEVKAMMEELNAALLDGSVVTNVPPVKP